MTNWDKFKETKLPPTEAFYSKLNMAGVREDDYEHAHRVRKEFGLKDLREYHDLYLNPIQAKLFYRLKVQGGGGSLGTPLMILGTIKTSPMKLCTVIVLHKVYQNTKRNFSKI